MYTRAGGFIADLDRFDAAFFGISPREARRMDPQHRLLLEVSWEALERAGMAVDRLAGSQTGVFVGMMTNQEYSLLQVQQSRDYANDPYFGLGGAASVAVGRLPYLFDFHGPAISVDTACSSSLVSVHLACQSLRAGECSLALAGGVNAIVLPENMVNACKMGMLAPDGRCKPFDATANGFVLGEGCGMVVLKRLTAAVADGDHILAIIRGSAVNQDGRSNGLTAPNQFAQQAVIRQALAQAGVQPGQVSYVEAHGSGTALGDPIEAQSLISTLCQERAPEQPLYIGAVKGNIGHLAGAAGIAGLIKTVLVLHRQQIPPHPHLREPNPHIPWQNSPLAVPTALTPLPAQDSPRIAGVSSFGWSGTNAHIVLEATPAPAANSIEQTSSRPQQLVLLSAKTETALEQAAVNLLSYMKRHPAANLADIAYTTQVGRSAFQHRQALQCQTLEEAVAALEKRETARRRTGIAPTEARPVAFLFPGLGEHSPGMTRQLYQQEAVFREAIDRCCDYLQSRFGLDVRAALYPQAFDEWRSNHTSNSYNGNHYSNGHQQNGASLSEINMSALLGRARNNGNGHAALNGDASSNMIAASRLKQTALAQPALFVIEYALAQLLISWGIYPAAMIGYSLGEYVAACLSGVLSLEDALMLVTCRAQLIEGLPRGAMLAAALSEADAQPYLDEQVNLAAINAPATCVFAGSIAAIERLEEQLSRHGIAHRRVATTHAFHSTMLESLREPLTALARTVSLHPPRIPYISNVTGTWITDEQATDPAYWSQHMCQTVRFADGVGQLLPQNEQVLLEVGPGQSLCSFVKQHPACTRERMSLVLPALPSSSDGQQEQAFLLTTIGKLWLAGATIDWAAFSAGELRQRVALPTYPFERQRYWIEDAKEKRQPTSQNKRPAIADWFYQPTWEQIALPEIVSQDNRASVSPILVFLDATGIGEQVAARLEQAGAVVVRAWAADHFARQDERRFTLRPGESADYLHLLRELSEAKIWPRSILHLWSLTAPGECISGSEGFRVMQERGFYSLQFLARALATRAIVDLVQVLVVSSNMQAVTGQEALQPEKATLLGACTVISQEYSDIQCRSIDLVLPEPGSDDERLIIDALLAECVSSAAEEACMHTAYRDGARWRQDYTALRLDVAGEITPLRQGGVYLITGGLGEIGLVLADYLARSVQARLVLTSRSGLPPRVEWPAWLEHHPAEDRLSRVIRQVQALEALGAEVLIVQADVADAAQMQIAIEQTIDRFGALHGVIHAAGITAASAFRPIASIGREECEQHFQPKAYGLYALEQALVNRDLDFCLLFSSISSILGGLSFAGYAAANCFMDAFTYRHNQTASTPWISVNWESWQLRPQQEQGSGLSKLGRTIAEYAMAAQEGLEVFHRILANRQSGQLIVSTGDLQARIQQWVRLRAIAASNHPEQFTTREAGAKHAQDSHAPAMASGELERVIAGIWRHALGVDQVGLYENFFDLGGNSLIGLQVLAQLKQIFHVQLPAVALFEAPTISALVKYLQPAMAQAVEEQPPHGDLLAHRRQQARQGAEQQEIAIIGMAGRFPGAANVEQFWHNLRNGVESIRFFSDEELLAAGVDPALLRDPNYVKARPILDDVEQFDAAFFGYSPREAELMDPQHRLFLESCWQALEDAAYDPQSYEGLIGVFGGANISTYLLGLSAHSHVLDTVDDYSIVISNDKDSLTTSVSYKLNLRGPSYAVQTFCSTSLVAVHLACQSLRQGECDMALAGGVSVRVPTVGGHLYQQGGMESPDGHVRTFDAQAKGSIFGDGVGVVVLKRLADALADGDQIAAVIRGSALNNDGSLKVSYTAPSVVGQAEVVSTALAQAGVEAESISYVEAHGTATELGDPIEVAALTKAYREQTQKVGYCAIGSVKTNVGHLDRAAGVSGLIKTVLALRHEELPPSLHYHAPNPEIDFANSPFYVNATLAPWQRGERVRRAGLNSLGMGGTNVHLILEEAPEQVGSGASRPWQMLLLSARTEAALEARTRQLRGYLEQHEGSKLADVAYTLQVGRERMAYRRAILCRDREEAICLLETRPAAWVWDRVEQRVDRPVAFLLPGVGEQYPGMARELYQQEATFREVVDRCCDFLQTRLGLDVRSVLLSGDVIVNEQRMAAPLSAMPDLRSLLGRNGQNGHHEQNGHTSPVEEQMKQTALAQPLVFVVEYALARLLMAWGIRPAALIGYSLGEYVAACLSGVLSLEDALTLVARRAQLIQELPRGAMLAVALSEADVQPYLDEQIDLAVINASATCVLAGPVAAIERLEERLSRCEIAHRRVETTHAFHSHMLALACEPLTELARGLALHEPRIPYISNVTGAWITAEQATDPAYWARHMCQTVRFANGVSQLLQQSEQVLLEVGPGQSLGSFVKQHPACGRERVPCIVSTMPSRIERQSEQAYLLTTLGKLWLLGVPVDWEGFSTHERRQRLSLPTYPFERQRYWIEAKKQISPDSYREIGADGELKRKDDITDWFSLPSWKQSLPPVLDESYKDKTGCWLLLSDACGIGKRLAEQLAIHQQDVITVLPGAAFARESEDVYTIRPDQRADYESLLKAMREQGKIPRRVVHLWSVTAPGAVDLDDMLAKGFYSLLALAQTLGDLALDDACEITVISNELQNVTGGERLCPEKATIIGPCRVIPQEYPTLSCRSIDICLPESGSWQEEALAQQLWEELIADSSVVESMVALRGESRWVQAFEAAALCDRQARGACLREGGVYLITGGLGGIGLALAAHLVRTLHAKLALLSRRGLPPCQEWPRILMEQGDIAGVGRQIRQVQMLEEAGAEMLIVAADVADEAQMRAAVQQTITAFGALHGVIHAAGVPGSGLMQLKSPEAAGRVLAPKVRGTLVLERVLVGLPLDFLVLFSSITAITGGPGQVDYCAANAFLDAYARGRGTRNGLTVAIDWSEWQWDAWEEGLLGYGEEARAFFKAHRQKFGISFEEGTEALRRILSYRLSNVVVSPQDFQAMVTLSRSFTTTSVLEKERQGQQGRELHPRPALGSSYVPPRSDLERQIAAVWEELLGITPVGVNDNFFELGGNSLMGVDLMTRLRKALRADSLAAYVLYEAPTVSALAHYVEQGRETQFVEERHERGEKRRESLKQRMHLYRHAEAEGRGDASRRPGPHPLHGGGNRTNEMRGIL
jgi:acyl transferase domain-containing protein/acyl carrier protein